MHLGDDSWNATRLRFKAFRRHHQFHRSIVLPFRSELPDAREVDALHARAASRAAAATSSDADLTDEARPILLFGSLTLGRNRERRTMVEAILNASASLPAGRVVLGDLGGGLDDVDVRAATARKASASYLPARTRASRSALVSCA